jgi:copper oxidase (laccase) domain-containing protein
MKSYEYTEADGFESQPERYRKIDELNKLSFLMTEGSSLQVIQSLHSVGASREVLTPKYSDNYQQDVIAEAQKISRHILAGNMSPLNNYGPGELTTAGRIEDAAENLNKFFHLNDIDPADVRLLQPERDYSTPLTFINVDTEPLAPDDTGLLRPDLAGDMLYTYNPDIVLAARPADCPIAFVSAETPNGELTALLHLATLGTGHNYILQSKKVLDTLGVDWDTARVQITPGAHSETYRFQDFTQYDPREKFPEFKTMFVDVEDTVTDKGEPAVNYGIDLAAEVYERIVKQWGIDEYQVFLDTTDTTSPTVGYSSHGRTDKEYEIGGDDTRDIVLAKRPN